MKVWELINEIKGTDADLPTILNWMMMNRICPLDVVLELEEGDHHQLHALAHKHCAPRKRSECDSKCYEAFLTMDVKEENENG